MVLSLAFCLIPLDVRKNPALDNETDMRKPFPDNSLEDLIYRHHQDVAQGHCDALMGKTFSGYTVLQKAPGQKVITLTYAPGINPPRKRRHVDVFVLDAGEQLGVHTHKEPTAAIAVVSGKGEVQVGMNAFGVEPGSETIFPARVPHDVKATGKKPLIFVSYQDYPILKKGQGVDQADYTKRPVFDKLSVRR